MNYRAPEIGLSPEGIILDIKERIGRGELQVGDKLPTTRELCDIYGLSPNTLSRCIRRLKENGYLSSRVGAGIYVTDPEGKTAARLEREHFKTTAFVFRIESTGDYSSDEYLSHVYDQAILGIQDQSLEMGTINGAVICPESVMKDHDQLQHFISRHSASADGVYFVGLVSSKSELLEKYARKPSVFVCAGHLGSHRQNVFCVDSYRSACSVMRHLLERSYQWIACLGGPLLGQSFRDQGYGTRHKAWHDLMTEFGYPTPDTMLFPSPESEEGIFLAAKKIVSLPPGKRPDAVFCFNDLRALILLETAKQSGLRVPKDLAIAGFDGNRQAIQAGITTIELPLYMNGRNAATTMRHLLNGNISPPVFCSYTNGVKIGKTT